MELRVKMTFQGFFRWSVELLVKPVCSELQPLTVEVESHWCVARWCLERWNWGSLICRVHPHQITIILSSGLSHPTQKIQILKKRAKLLLEKIINLYEATNIHENFYLAYLVCHNPKRRQNICHRHKGISGSLYSVSKNTVLRLLLSTVHRFKTIPEMMHGKNLKGWTTRDMTHQ